MVKIRSSSAGRVAHNVALAALLGGNLFGRLAMNPALTEISDSAERGKVLNRAWRRYGTVNSLALVALVGGWRAERGRQGRLAWLRPRRRVFTAATDVAVGAVVVTGLASAASGVEFAQQAPGGAVPMTSGHDPAPNATPRATHLKRLVNALGALNTVAEVALVTINALRPR